MEPQQGRLKRIRMDITDNCNLRCTICTIHDHRPKGHCIYFKFEKFAETFGETIRDIANFQLGNTCEPLMHPEFDRFVDFLRREFEGTILIQTNGLLLDRHLAALERNRCSVNISVDSLNKQTYERIRKGSSFDRVKETMDKINSDACQVCLTPVLMNSTIHEYADFVKYTENRNFKLAGVPMVIRSTEQLVSMDNVKECLWFNKTAILKLRETFFSTGRPSHVVARCFDNRHETFRCTAHHEDAIVLADGNCMLCFIHSLGNINQSRFQDLFYSGRADEFRKQIDSGNASVCKSCNYRIQCLTPSVDYFRNHVDLGIYGNIPPHALEQLAFDSPLSDKEQMSLFIDEVSRTMHVYDLFERDGFIYACAAADTVVGTDRPSITKAIAQKPKKPTRFFVDPVYKGFRIIEAEGRFHAFAEELGNVDLYKIKLDQFRTWRDNRQLFVSSSLEGLKIVIDMQCHPVS